MQGNDLSRCWLCGSSEQLTSEHFPPRSAFNDRPVAVERLSDQALESGYVAWEPSSTQTDGHATASLCRQCNQRGGRVFVNSYLEIVRKIAEKVRSRIPLVSISINDVKNPQLILRQIVLQFVSANGASFVAANTWVKELLLSRKPVRLPGDVKLYLFATQTLGMRTSGISGHIRTDKNDYRVVSEFTFWPLGTVLSYCALNDEPLLEITEWSQLPFRFKGTFDLNIPVNPADSEYPIDFRDHLDMYLDTLKVATALPREDLFEQMKAEVILRRGSDDGTNILTAAPSAHRLFSERASAPRD